MLPMIAFHGVPREVDDLVGRAVSVYRKIPGYAAKELENGVISLELEILPVACRREKRRA